MNYVYMLIGGLLGMLFYSLRKVNGIRKRMRKDVTYANYTWKQTFAFYFEHEVISLAISLLIICISMFISTEFMRIPTETTDVTPKFNSIAYWKNLLVHFSRAVFILIGFCGNSISDMIAGKTEYLLDAIAKGKKPEEDNTPLH